MKVALVHSYYSSRQPSGENVVVDAQASVLRQHGIEVCVVGARTDDLEHRPGYKLRSAVNVAFGRGLSPVEELNDFEPDMVHVHNLFPNWSTDWLSEWKGPIVTTLHNFRPVCAAGTLFRNGKACTQCPEGSSLYSVVHACYRDSRVASIPLAVRSRHGAPRDKLLARAERVILLSPRAKALYSEFGLPPDKLEVIPNFVSDVGFRPEIRPGRDWVYIGRLTAEKGILNLLKHWPKGRTLRIFGDGPLRGEVEALTGPHIIYMGRLNHEEVPNVLAESQGLVFPSEWAEGLPLVYAEALASGRPVVAKTGNSAADDVIDSGVGAVFDAWTGLDAALEHVVLDAEELRVRARARFESHYSRAIWLNKTMALYESVGKAGA